MLGFLIRYFVCLLNILILTFSTDFVCISKCLATCIEIPKMLIGREDVE